MKFLSPEAFAFAAALPVVVVFYLLKRKRVVRVVSSTLLWQKFLAETQASAPFQRLRHNWLLVLQLLLLALAVFALARPYLKGDAPPSRMRVLILDASASMQSTDDKPTRFEHARAEALKWVAGLQSDEHMVVLLAGANTVVKQSATSSKVALRRALENCSPTDSPTRLGEAFKLAETLIKNESNPEIHLFSDGAIPNLGEFENKSLPLVYHRFGVRCQNLGVASIDVRANPENPAQRAIFASVINPTTNELSNTIELRLDNQLVDSRPITVPPTNTMPLVFVADQGRDGVFTVKLREPDDLAADNQASIVSILPQPVKIQLVTKGNQYLEKALRSAGNVEISVAPQTSDSSASFDLVVLDDVMPAVWPAANTLAIHTMNTNWFEGVTPVENPAIVDWKNTHPLLRSINFDNVQIMQSLGVKPPPWGTVVVESPQTPLVIAGEIDRHRVVWIGFDVLQSTWPYRIYWPMFMANVVEWLNPASASASELTVKAGEPFRVALAQMPATAQVIHPDGKAQTLTPDPKARELVFGDTEQQGIYHLKAGGKDIPFCVNLMDAAESATAPREALPFGKYNQVAASTMTQANMEWWRWIAFGALLVLLFEWWFYHKRTA